MHTPPHKISSQQSVQTLGDYLKLKEARDARPVRCPRCGGTMAPGQALEPTLRGTPDFSGGPVVTMSPGGPGRLVDCDKCPACGHSVTA